MALKQLGWAAFIGVSLAFAGGGLAAAKMPRMTSEITAPSAGASVSSPVTVTYSLSSADAPPPSGSSDGSWPATSSASAPRHLPQAYLVIDSPTPAAGSTLQADADHVAFPAGQMQISVPLAAGSHQLQVVFVNRKGLVTRHFEPSGPVSISVH